MPLYLSVPSKTFLLGEYAVLHGAPGIILNTEPRFTLLVNKNEHKKMDVIGIHPESPAGKLINALSFYQDYSFRFLDPYQNLGGFGASSAQFVMVTAFKNYILGKQTQDFELIDHYLQYAWDGQGLAPSGVDLIAQLHGEICYFNKNQKKLLTFAWPFQDLAYCLIHTGNKLPTHDHLKQLNLTAYRSFDRIVEKGLQSLQAKNSEAFIESINHYAEALEKNHLVLDQTKQLIDQLSLNPDILAMKGCGALGADVILMIYHDKNQDKLISWIKAKNLHMIKYGKHVANGLKIGVS